MKLIKLALIILSCLAISICSFSFQSNKNYVLKSITLTPNHMTLDTVKDTVSEKYVIDLLNGVISKNEKGKPIDQPSADNANQLVNILVRYSMGAIATYEDVKDEKGKPSQKPYTVVNK